ncbi:class II aldolase/adducin family protein [Oceanirhabdus seepicola]|uniref:Class II aldolase/adducin family protein n=1 Tax=Oceanirhabdus seepicola TaxID=2828781 RepID=A0A9J6P3T7_9CLOT|nr:class II aldolase/adducin family protein [Oceanirhabdus seepicola]MCM1990216.1 class II aldolase/adducin family protein [Oceanirhabdus seepicola]
MNIKEAKNLVIKAGIKLVESGLIARTWGNVSCRVDENTFVITPSGRNYLSLTPDEIVEVNIADLSYKGNIKPSSEKGIHAEVYKLYPNIKFVIHTHQESASVIGASELNSIEINGYHPSLDGKVLFARYALPGTKSLRKNVAKSLMNSKTNAVIMKYHGALCFGKDYDEAFMIASALEKACDAFMVKHYLRLSKREKYNPLEMSTFALSQSGEREPSSCDKIYFNSKRTENGCVLYMDGEKIEVNYDNIDSSLPEEVEIYKAIFTKNKNINHILFNNSPEIRAISHKGIKLKPLLDDFAQLVGRHVKNVENNPRLISEALKKSSVILVRNIGALCCGKTYDDAEAVSMVTQKASKALIGASLLGKVKPINPLECMLMRYVYLKKYSKKVLKE